MSSLSSANRQSYQYSIRVSFKMERQKESHLSEADTRYVKKSGSIMTGALSTPSLLVNSIDVETQLNKISSLETKTTDITFAGSTTTIANNLDIDDVLSTLILRIYRN